MSTSARYRVETGDRLFEGKRLDPDSSSDRVKFDCKFTDIKFDTFSSTIIVVPY